jgi:hypothetical protein
MRKFILMLAILSLFGCVRSKIISEMPVKLPDGQTTIAKVNINTTRIFMQTSFGYNPATGITYGSDASGQFNAMLQAFLAGAELGIKSAAIAK